jgi:hypothetical protein
MPGGFMTVSCHNSPAEKDSGVIWANHPWRGNANNAVRPGVLHAFDAADIKTPIWSSRKKPHTDTDPATKVATQTVNVAQDDVGNFAKFCCPTVANGHVYQASMGGIQQLDDSQKLLNQTTKCTPAIVGLKHKLLLAWTSSLDGSVKTLTSTEDNSSTSNGQTTTWSSGLTWNSGSAQTVPGASSQLQPSLASDIASETAYLAWTDKSSGTVMLSRRGKDEKWSVAKNLQKKSSFGPAITYGRNTLLVAWVEDSGLINVMGWVGSQWKQPSQITAVTDLNLRPHSSSRPYLAFNQFAETETFVLAWSDKTKGLLNFLEFTDVTTLQTAHTVTINETPPVLDPTPKYDSPQQPPDRLSASNPPPSASRYGIAIDFLPGHSNEGKPIGVPIIAYVSEFNYSQIKKREFKSWNAINTAVSDDSSLLSLNHFSTHYRMYYDTDTGQKACDGVALAHYMGKVFVAWVFDKSDPTNEWYLTENNINEGARPEGIVDDYCVNVGVLSRGSVAVYGLNQKPIAPATTTGSK